jgi:pyruvate,water dikinase
MKDTGIFNETMDILDALDVNNNKELQKAARDIKDIINKTKYLMK